MQAVLVLEDDKSIVTEAEFGFETGHTFDTRDRRWVVLPRHWIARDAKDVS